MSLPILVAVSSSPPSVDRRKQPLEFRRFPLAEEISNVVGERSHLRRGVPRVPRKVNVTEEEARRRLQYLADNRNGTQHIMERSVRGAGSQPIAVLYCPSFPHGNDEAADRSEFCARRLASQPFS